MDTSRQSSGSFIPSSMYRRIEAIKHIKSTIRLFSYGTFIKKFIKGVYKKKSACIIRNVARVTTRMWGFSSAGRAPALHAGGQEFESPNLQKIEVRFFFTSIFFV